MEILFLIIGSWIAVALTVIIGFLYLMVTTPVDRDEDGEYTTKLFAKEQSYKSMLKILGY